MIDMTNFKGRKAPGRDYSTALRDMLPSLLSVPMSKQEIAKATERDFETVSHLFVKIRSSVHIAGWKRGRSGPIEALWLYGPGKDSPKPAALTSAEKSARWRNTPHGKILARKYSKRWRKSENGRDWTKSYRSARYARKKFESGGVAAIDPLLAAIMGPRA
jgi:hypothetical protein